MITILVSLLSKVKANLKKYAIYASLIILGLFGVRACDKVQKKHDQARSAPVLAHGQKEKIIINPANHTIEVVTKNSDKKTFLPDGPVAVVEDKKGNLSVEARRWGGEVKPYVGVGGSTDATARIHGGTDLFYFHRLDLGVGLDLNTSVFKNLSAFTDTRLSINASYNFYSNTSLALSVDNRKFVGLFIKLRL